MSKKYVVTKKECQEAIDKRGYVCDYCGRDIQACETVDNAGTPTHWAGCYHGGGEGAWGQFTQGVPKETYKLAYKLVLDDDMYWIDHSDCSDDFDYQFRQDVHRVARMLRDIDYIKIHKPRHTKTELRKRYKQMQKLRGSL